MFYSAYYIQPMINKPLLGLYSPMAHFLIDTPSTKKRINGILIDPRSLGDLASTLIFHLEEKGVFTKNNIRHSFMYKRLKALLDHFKQLNHKSRLTSCLNGDLHQWCSIFSIIVKHCQLLLPTVSRFYLLLSAFLYWLGIAKRYVPYGFFTPLSRCIIEKK